MSQDSPPAMLIATHADILPFCQNETTTELAGVVPPTRTIASSQYLLGEGPCQIGRDPACQVRVDEQRTDISRRHATIKREEDGYVLYDHSLHGTFVNGQRVNGMRRLDSGDGIGLASSREMLHFVDSSQSRQEPIALTEREREILRLLVGGHRVKAIASALFISPNTVNSHMKSIYEKLGVNSRGEAISQAIKRHLV